jgi:hypothetical protein
MLGTTVSDPSPEKIDAFYDWCLATIDVGPAHGDTISILDDDTFVTYVPIADVIVTTKSSLERATRIELAFSTWKAADTRLLQRRHILGLAFINCPFGFLVRQVANEARSLRCWKVRPQ